MAERCSPSTEPHACRQVISHVEAEQQEASESTVVDRQLLQ